MDIPIDICYHFLDDIFSPSEDQDIFSNKSDNLFSKGKNLFSDEQPSSSWKNKPVRPVNTNVIPPSIDMPPPLSIVCKFCQNCSTKNLHLYIFHTIIFSPI